MITTWLQALLDLLKKVWGMTGLSTTTKVVALLCIAALAVVLLVIATSSPEVVP